MPKERSFTRSARINVPQQQLWDFMTDLSNAPRWITGVSKTEVMTPGPVGPGTVLRETRTIGNRTESYDVTVAAFEPPSTYAAGVRLGKAEFAYRFELKPAGGATDVTMLATARGRGLMWALFGKMGFRFMEKYDGNQLEQLKAAAEGKP
jgi:carbon monoxide dehydrogenase subunit G